jgi:hypothetical protein
LDGGPDWTKQKKTEEEKGKRRGKRKEEREEKNKKEGNRNLENFPNQKFMGISKIMHKELVQKSILYKWKK